MRVEIIAELGVNANGDTKTGRKLIDAAKEAGADTVKFQATFPRLEMSRRLLPERVAMTEKVILHHDQLEDLIAYCRRQANPWLVTPSEEASLVWLMKQEPDRIKIGSDNLTNLPFIEQVARHGLPVLFSTGMSNDMEVAGAYSILRQRLIPADITLMHCTSAYPCPIEQANLLAIETMRKTIGSCRYGWSDHTESPFLACAAVALGAVVIEKHLTLDRRQKGPDHAASLDPLQFATMVRLIRETEKALGDGSKFVQPCEIENRMVTRKSLTAARHIEAGETLVYPGNVAIQRPGIGKPPSALKDIVGKPALRGYEEGEVL